MASLLHYHLLFNGIRHGLSGLSSAIRSVNSRGANLEWRKHGLMMSQRLYAGIDCRDRINADHTTQFHVMGPPAVRNNLRPRHSPIERAVVDGDAGENPDPRSLEFDVQFVTTISARFRRIRATLGDLIGGAIRLMPKKATRELVVCCALSNTTLLDVRRPVNPDD